MLTDDPPADRSPLMTVVAAALLDADGRVLVQRRPPGKPMAGLWEFPGGKLEEGELPEPALARELAEELGIAVAADAMEACVFASEALGRRHLLLLLYLVRRWSGTPEPRHATELAWVTLDALPTLDMPPADVPLVKLLEAVLSA